MSQLASFGNVSPDITALCQQAALVTCLYQNDRVRAEELLGADGTILIWTFRDDTWPPSHAVIRSGAGRYFVVFTGTTNGWQAGIHVGGTFWRRWLDSNSLVNGQWQSVLDAVYDEIRPALPIDLNDATTHISGHSYGGALGQLLANKLVDESAPGRVQLMTFGAPKALSPDYLGPQPAIYWRIASDRDLVSYMPPDGGSYGTLLWENPVSWALLPIHWRHYGRGRYLGWNGELDTAEPVPAELPTGVANSSIEEHKLRNYWGRLRQRTINVESTPAAVAALVIMDLSLLGPPAQSVPNELPRRVRGPSGVQLIDIPGYDGVPIPSLIGAFPMPEPTYLNLTGNRMMHATQFFNADRQGWSESYYLFVEGANDNPHTICHLWLQVLNAIRRPVLPTIYAIEGQRVADVDNLRDGSPHAAPNYNLGDGEKTGTVAPPERGWNVIVRDSTKQVGLTRIYRGWPIALVPYLVQGGPVVTEKPAIVRNWFTATAAHLTQSYTNPGAPGTVRAAIRTYDRRIANSPVRQVTAFNVDNETGFLSVTTNETALSFNVGDRVKLTAGRKKCIKGLGGEARVLARELVQGFARYATDKKICCFGASLVGILGTIRLDATGYVAIADATLGYTAKRDVGRAFFVTAGAHKGKCC